MSKVRVLHGSPVFLARVAELADALDLGSSVFDVGVQVPPRAPSIRGRGSAVEHRLAKARVAGSIPVVRSILIRALSSAG